MDPESCHQQMYWSRGMYAAPGRLALLLGLLTPWSCAFECTDVNIALLALQDQYGVKYRLKNCKDAAVQPPPPHTHTRTHTRLTRTS